MTILKTISDNLNSKAMKTQTHLRTVAFIGIVLLVAFSSCSRNSSIRIGNQEWMTENLNVDHFRNGDPIPQAKTREEWQAASWDKKPAWCYYDNDAANGRAYGKLYNWYAVNDPRELAPEGWHVPSNVEWTILSEYLGGKEIEEKMFGGFVSRYTLSAGGKMKSTGTQYWKSPNAGATNSSGFSALPGGGRTKIGDFHEIGSAGNWWGFSQAKADEDWARSIYYDASGVNRHWVDKGSGFSVRCLREIRTIPDQ